MVYFLPFWFALVAIMRSTWCNGSVHRDICLLSRTWWGPVRHATCPHWPQTTGPLSGATSWSIDVAWPHITVECNGAWSHTPQYKVSNHFSQTHFLSDSAKVRSSFKLVNFIIVDTVRVCFLIGSNEEEWIEIYPTNSRNYKRTVHLCSIDWLYLWSACLF